MRNFNRKHDELRNVSVEVIKNGFAEGGCVISFGKTKVLCNATVEHTVPKWLDPNKSGWVTAEYSMLPRATFKRTTREISLGKKSSRSTEIQRLIGRCIRSIVDLTKIPGFQIILDCDVLLADGGTRTTSINGSFIALYLAIKKLLKEKLINNNPIRSYIAAISCGIVDSEVMLDLDFDEDARADVDANFILDSSLNICEIQASAEKRLFSEKQFYEMLDVSKKGVSEIIQIQRKIIDD